MTLASCHIGRMDLSRRAPTPAPVPENRRIADLYRPITTANYGTAIPLIIGQHRASSTIIRDGRKSSQTDRPWIPNDELRKVLYGLCEAQVMSIPTEYGNDTGAPNPAYQPKVSQHIGYPIVYVSKPAPDGTDSPADLSYEVSSDILITGTGNGNYIQTGGYLHQAADGTDAFNEDKVGGGTGVFGEPSVGTGLPANFVSEFHVCYTGSGATLAQWMVVFDRAANSIKVFFNALGGQGGDTNWTICDGFTNAALRPAAGAMVQPRIAAVGGLVHVVWSVLDNSFDNAGKPAQIAHVWTANGGTAWTAGQSISLAAKPWSCGVWRLSVNVHASGEVWTCFQRKVKYDQVSSTVLPSKGVVVGFLPSNAISSTAWILPTATPTGASIEHLADNELCIFTFFAGMGPDTAPRAAIFSEPFRIRGPSVMPLGGGKALLSVVYKDRNGMIQCRLFVLPIVASTEVAWDLPAGAFATTSEGSVAHNVANLLWLQANGFAGQTLSYYPYGTGDNFRNAASTQLIDVGVGAFGVLVLSQPGLWNGTSDRFSLDAVENIDMGGSWSLPWGTWNGTAITWTTPIIPAWKASGFLANAFCNGSGQVYIAMGIPDNDGVGIHGEFYDIDATAYRTRQLSLVMLPPGWIAPKQVWTYSPGTALNDSIMYQFWAGNGDVLTSIRENEDLVATYTVGIRRVVQFSGYGDVLPSVICKRLLTGDVRGLNLPNVVFDSVTWGQFDNYCQAMGIKFSLVLTSQQAAWPLVCDILESANAMPYRSEGMIKVLVRETASITANGATYTPIWTTAVAIDPRDFRDGVPQENPAIDSAWNSLRVTWKNRKRAYADEPYQLEDAGSVSRKGRIPASAVDWPWICDPQVVAVCTWLRLSQQRRFVSYKFALPQKYMLLEVGDIVEISFPDVLPAKKVRITSMEEDDGDWIECIAEVAPITGVVIQPPRGGSGSSGATVQTPTPINLPILFVALIGGLLRVWCLLSWPAQGTGCAVWQSWDASSWAQVGTCSTPSPTGHLVQDMARLRAQPGLRCRPGLRVGVADFATADYSECALVPPVPTWTGFQAGNPGSLLWVNGELMAYALESDAGSIASCSMLRRGLYGTTLGKHPILSRVGAVTDAAWTMGVPPGREGQTCYFRFPAPGESLASVPTYSVEIPA